VRHRGGRVTIETQQCHPRGAEHCRPDEQPGAYAVIASAIRGTGIRRKSSTPIFDRFFTTKGVGKGSGLGLSQVYGLRQGKRWPCSRREHARRRHRDVDLTCALGGAPQRRFRRRAVGANPDALPGVSGEVVLVVEDDADVLAMTIDSLNELGYVTLAAQNADEALIRLRRPDRVDILFSDVVMPGGMNGAQLAVEARRLRPGYAFSSSGYTASALSSELGVSSDLPVLSKPYRREDLSTMLRELAARSATAALSALSIRPTKRHLGAMQQSTSSGTLRPRHQSDPPPLGSFKPRGGRWSSRI